MLSRALNALAMLLLHDRFGFRLHSGLSSNETIIITKWPNVIVCVCVYVFVFGCYVYKFYMVQSIRGITLKPIYGKIGL